MADLRIERAVVTGGREFTDYNRIEADLRALLPFGLRRVAHGGASGADSVADAVARRVFPLDAFRSADGGVALHEADWQLDGRAAGPRRNIRMLEAEQPDLVLAFPDPASRGTWHCVREACKRGITCVVWAPFCEAYDFMGEDGIKPGICVDGPKGNIIRIDDQRRESHGRASDGGWASLTLIEGSAVPHSSRFAVCVFDREEQTEALMEALGDAPALRGCSHG